jgi:hypothetical protein
MPDLFHALRGYDLGQLQIIAGLWGLDLQAKTPQDAAQELVAALHAPRLGSELISSLPDNAVSALNALARAGGRIPWAAFERQYGGVREMGAGRRDREKPYLRPASPGETLYYRGILARAFFDTDKGPQEFAYLPDDWLPLIRQSPEAGSPVAAQVLGRRATPAERRLTIPATDRILDEATTYLAAVRSGQAPDLDPVLRGLLGAAGLLKRDVLQAAAVKTFLETPRRDALKMLVSAWRDSEEFNELRLVPGLVCEGEWRNDARTARGFLLSLLRAIPRAAWWSLASFVDGVNARFPDFQRPAGNYDSWFIKDAEGTYLRGFSNWDRVDGALIRFLVSGVMLRLGMLDLASPGEGREPVAFRVLGADGRGPERSARFPELENAKLRVAARGTVTAPRLVPRTVRYQLARFCEWEDEKDDGFRYRVTPQSLTRAAAQGLTPEHLLALLAKHADAGIPPILVKALKRWETSGTEARMETQTILRVNRPEILDQLRKSKAAKYLGEPLGPTSVIVKGGAVQKVTEAMTELGLFMEDRTSLST